MNANKVILVIMDGWGIPTNPDVSAIDRAKTPFYDHSLHTRPHSNLRASEEWVGLPKGQMGNSEVGHMNIGAGRVVYQELVRISKAIEDGSIRELEVYRKLVSYCKENNKPLHLMGLLSDGGVHSHIDHLKGILSYLAKEGLPEVYIHAFMDGRDTDPNGGEAYLNDLEAHLKQAGTGKIASVIGRYFAMDRDKRWERIKKGYDLIVHGKGETFNSAVEGVKASYAANTTDEFIEPISIRENGEPVATLQKGDAVLVFNFRTDRARQLTQVLTQEANETYDLQPLDLHYATLTRYDESFKGVKVLFEKEDLKMTLGEVLANAGKTQVRIAETEKYPHVTFFFSGGRENEFEGESRLLCPSPKVATYDLQPEMSAREIRDKILPVLQSGSADFIILNFANPDMVGHTGVFEAAVSACETVDACTKEVVETALSNGYTALVTADHGNADFMRNADGSPHTAHTTALVPLLLFEPEQKHALKDGKLGDLAPTILNIMGVDIPEEMTGEVLLTPAPQHA